ncbi:MAG: hypothetical protein K0Q73_6919 [Paenibacillus sp.]|jgi:hypothetical protein|nr:hypothetical protein [Paenibacillus sp.]
MKDPLEKGSVEVIAFISTDLIWVLANCRKSDFKPCSRQPILGVQWTKERKGQIQLQRDIHIVIKI